MGKHKNIKTPERLLELWEQYKNNIGIGGVISMNSFEQYLNDKNIAANPSNYFDNKDGRYNSFSTVAELIKEEIFNYKLNLYKRGRLHHRLLCKEASDRGIVLGGAARLGVLHSEANMEENQFEINDGILTVKKSFLRGKHHTAEHKMNKTVADTIYVLNVRGSDIYKIGVSQNVNRRIKDIQSSNPFIIDVVFVKKVLFALEVEQSIHEKIKNQHIKNEWFKIKDIDLIIKNI